MIALRRCRFVAQNDRAAERRPYGFYRKVFAKSEFRQLSICLPRKPATVWASFWSLSCMGEEFSPMSSMLYILMLQEKAGK